MTDFLDPFVQETWAALKWLKPSGVQIGYPIGIVGDTLCDAAETVLGKRPVITQKIRAHQTQSQGVAIPNVKNVIAVASGKGGVGKSTTAVNLALALKAHGAAVGLLDADIHGPNQPLMLGSRGEKPETEDKKFKPVMLRGIPTMSIGYLMDAAQPTIWRGPMVSSALKQLLNDTAWPELDYLVIDMPPGTGDIQLTLAQHVPVSGAVIVTTPQNVALQDARKGLAMFKKVGIPVLGVLENMSFYHCPSCGHQDFIFDEGGGVRFAEQFAVPLLGQIPLNSEIRALADSGKPAVLFGDDAIREAYLAVAIQVAAALAIRPVSYAATFGEIKVE